MDHAHFRLGLGRAVKCLCPETVYGDPFGWGAARASSSPVLFCFLPGTSWTRTPSPSLTQVSTKGGCAGQGRGCFRARRIQSATWGQRRSWLQPEAPVLGADWQNAGAQGPGHSKSSIGQTHLAVVGKLPAVLAQRRLSICGSALSLSPVCDLTRLSILPSGLSGTLPQLLL